MKNVMKTVMKRARVLGITVAFLPTLALADFGLSSSTDFYTVDTGAGLTFKVRRTDNGVSTQSAGDIASLKYYGVEYQNQSRGSQVNSGFDWLYSNTSSVSVNATTVNNQFIKVTVNAGNLTHYYMARRGYPHIYMGTYFTTEPNVHGHVRYILRLSSSLLPNGPEHSDLRGTVSTVEASDIFAMGNGETRSKHYSNMRLKDWQYIGATGGNVGMWVVRGNQEGGSGGPFYRSLLNQTTDNDQELTYIVNYAEAQTEAFRTGILNNYTFVVTNGSQPNANIDTSWFSQMGLNGYVPSYSRGVVAAVGINGRDSRYDYTVGFANSRAQYWADTNESTGFFKSADMLPGTYTMTIYKNELAVYSQNVNVSAGESTLLHTINITDDPSYASAIWRIGDWDGSPQEFYNGDKLTIMHPSDTRIYNWDPGNFIVGTHDDSHFPAYFWKDVNNNHIIYFKLSPEELSRAHTIRVGLTCAFSGGRPRLYVNDWTSPVMSPSDQPKTRTLTVGTYRCNNVTYSYDVPASAWQQSSGNWNRLVMEVISGSGGSGYLSPAISVDTVELLD
ncbi:hypothetical Protein YC6258_00528 [Gynuella sunshinyii YC6258]|uniref:rhamnogalacturonan endolyase n=2 Tax=Gynuella sunshinyii TaxID=1445505 RepID=A0A0C5VGS0_9GAMM|nr:hypothetical Protein YC6258_00528 [Gynuella sunshinyii YC6258]